MTPHDYTFKIILIGDSGVGKSCWTVRFADGEYTPGYQPTIGVDFKTRTIECEDKNIKLHMWDTAGQEQFRSIIASYYRGIAGVVLMYDVTERQTFERLRWWRKEIEANSRSGDSPRVIVVGNKVDKDKRAVSVEEAKEWARQNGMLYHETSGRTGEGIDNCMMRLAHDIYQHFERDSKFVGVRPADHIKELMPGGVAVKTRKCCTIL